VPRELFVGARPCRNIGAIGRAWLNLSPILSSAAPAPISLSMSFVVYFRTGAGNLRVVSDVEGRIRVSSSTARMRCSTLSGCGCPGPSM